MGALKLFDGTNWLTIVSTGATIAATAPSSPIVGAFWYDTTAQMLKIWNGTAWASATFSQNISQTTLTGGGLRDYQTGTNPGISWSSSFLIRAALQSSLELTTVTMPANGVVITGYGTAAGQTVAGGRIPLANQTTLYYDVPAGGSATTDNARFKIAAGYAASTPRSWVPIASRDDSAGVITWGDGRVGWEGDSGGAIGPVAGPWSSANPANSTTGAQFTIAREGVYLLEADASGYVTVGGSYSFNFFIDGVQAASRAHYFNTVSEHSIPLRTAWKQTLSAGTHYFYVKYGGSSDSNDSGLLTWTRV